MPDFTLRPATPDDAPDIAKLWLEVTTEVSKHEPIYTPNISRTDLTEQLRTELETGARKAFVAYSGSELAGYVTFRVENESPIFAPRQYVYVIDLDVSAMFRQQGLSRLLMAEVEAYARVNGIKRLELAVIFADPRARAVWEHHGFRPHALHLHKDL